MCPHLPGAYLRGKFEFPLYFRSDIGCSGSTWLLAVEELVLEVSVQLSVLRPIRMRQSRTGPRIIDRRLSPRTLTAGRPPTRSIFGCLAHLGASAMGLRHCTMAITDRRWVRSNGEGRVRLRAERCYEERESKKGSPREKAARPEDGEGVVHERSVRALYQKTDSASPEKNLLLQ